MLRPIENSSSRTRTPSPRSRRSSLEEKGLHAMMSMLREAKQCSEEEYDINERLRREAELAVHGGHRGILPSVEREAGHYPGWDFSVWLRSCTREVADPLPGKVTGRIPGWLDGSLLQNGPGKLYFGSDTFNHMFDGSSLVQKFVLSNGAAWYQCRFLRSQSFAKNMAAGRIAVSELGTFAPPPPEEKQQHTSLLERLKALENDTTDNAVVTVNRVGDDYYCATESPFAIKLDVESLKTKERVDLKAAFKAITVVAHPHYDPEGNMYTVCLKSGIAGCTYSIMRIPVADEGVVEASSDEECPAATGNLAMRLAELHGSIVGMKLSDDDDEEEEEELERADFSVERFRMAKEVAEVKCRWSLHAGYMHSFSVTENFYVLVEQPLTVNLTKVLRAQLMMKETMDALEWLSGEPTVFHVIARDPAAAPVKRATFKSEPFMFLHTVNAFEDRGHVVVDLVAYDDAAVLKQISIRKLATANADPNYAGGSRCRARRYVLPLNPANPRVELEYTTARAEVRNHSVWVVPQVICRVSCEFPTVHYDRFNGKPYRYFYANSADCDDPDGCMKVLKVDTASGEVLAWSEPNTFCSEPMFVPRPSSFPSDADEDDGVVLSSVVKGTPDVSYAGILVLDAKTMKELGRAEFQLDSPAPKALHGCFAPARTTE